MLATALLACALVAIDGDTLRCGRERIRLIGIDAPEQGRCPVGRRCVQGDPDRSRRHLAAGLAGRATIRRFGRDRYGRTLAMVRVGGQDLSCRQLAGRTAIYVARWDNRGAVARACPTLTRYPWRP